MQVPIKKISFHRNFRLNERYREGHCGWGEKQKRTIAKRGDI